MAQNSLPQHLLPQQRRTLLIILSLCLPLSLLLAILFGAVSLPVSDIGSALSGLFNSSQAANSRNDLIIQQIRLPRALLAMFIGAILGICGTLTQGLFRNPLADPSLIGVTAGASTGAALVIFLGGSAIVGFIGLSLISIGAFVFGSLTVLLVYRLATHHGHTSVATMLLASIAITAIAGSLTSLLEFFANNEMLRRITLWRMGALDGATYGQVGLAAFIAVSIALLAPRFSTVLNALLLGESEARHLGIAVQKVKIQIILLVSAGVGTSVALAGSIAFVGLMVPHILRFIIGPNHHYLLPSSALGGAILLLLADTCARTALAPTELPVGLVTALLGAPFFIFLLRQRHHFGMHEA